MKWLKLAIRNVLRNGKRSLVTVMIIAVGTAGAMISGGFGLYTYDSLREQAARDSGHLTIAHKDYFEREEDSVLEMGLENHEEIQAKLSGDAGVRAVLPRLSFSGLISNGDKSTIYVGSGVNPTEFGVKGPFLNLTSGKNLSKKPDPEQDPGVMLGSGLARNLGATPGSFLTLLSTTTEGAMNAVDVRVVGVFSEGIPERDARQLYVHLETAQILVDSNKVSTLSVFLYETSETEAYEVLANKAVPELGVSHWETQAVFYSKVKSLYDRIFGIMGFIIALLVFFSVSNTLAMSVIERTREIGTLAAMGSYPREIVRNFVLEALVMAFVGLAVGITIAAVVSFSLYFVELEMPPPPGRSEAYPLYVYFSPVLAAGSAVVLSTLCAVAAWVTAAKGCNKPIVEALGHV